MIFSILGKVSIRIFTMSLIRCAGWSTICSPSTPRANMSNLADEVRSPVGARFQCVQHPLRLLHRQLPRAGNRWRGESGQECCSGHGRCRRPAFRCSPCAGRARNCASSFFFSVMSVLIARTELVRPNRPGQLPIGTPSQWASILRALIELTMPLAIMKQHLEGAVTLMARRYK